VKNEARKAQYDKNLADQLAKDEKFAKIWAEAERLEAAKAVVPLKPLKPVLQKQQEGIKFNVRKVKAKRHDEERKEQRRLDDLFGSIIRQQLWDYIHEYRAAEHAAYRHAVETNTLPWTPVPPGRPPIEPREPMPLNPAQQAAKELLEQRMDEDFPRESAIDRVMQEEARHDAFVEKRLGGSVRDFVLRRVRGQ
jgi:hypothetical protein